MIGGVRIKDLLDNGKQLLKVVTRELLQIISYSIKVLGGHWPILLPEYCLQSRLSVTGQRKLSANKMSTFMRYRIMDAGLSFFQRRPHRWRCSPFLQRDKGPDLPDLLNVFAYRPVGRESPYTRHVEDRHGRPSVPVIIGPAHLILALHV
jgi:hypothetical protein